MTYGSRLRASVWVFHMALPVVGLWLLLAQPELDVRWEDHVAHFWLVLGSAAVSFAIAAWVSREAGNRGDARLFIVSLAFAASAGFLGLHAIATPGIILPGPNAGFVLATPVGLLLAALCALAAAVELQPAAAERIVRARNALRGALVLLLVGWAGLSVIRIPWLDEPLDPPRAHPAVVAVAIVAAVAYVVAAGRFFVLYRRRRSVVLLSVITAFVLLGESSIATAYGRNWQASWWSWHVLMLLAFAFVAYSAYVQYRREGSARGLFAGVSLEESVQQIREDYHAALETLVAAIERQAETGVREPVETLTASVAARFGLTERQADVLARGAEALSAERDQQRRLAALVAIGQESSVIQEERELLARATAHVRSGFTGAQLDVVLVRDGRLPGEPDPVRTQAVTSGELVFDDETRRVVLPLMVKGHTAGVLDVRGQDGLFAERDVSLLRSLASQMSVALENARLYRQLDGLFRSYMSPAVATALIADPDQAALGGAIEEVTVLMADLQGFTPFSERTAPGEVVTMLNTYFGAIVPGILAEGGTVVQFVGDAVMALFNAPVRQPDHALRSVRAGMRLHDAVAAVAKPGWPRFRVGVNTGSALVGNIGAEQFRNFTAIGDTTNLAARLEGVADPGGIVVGPRTRSLLGAAAVVEPLGAVTVKGKHAPVEAYRVVSLADPPPPG